MAEWSKLSFLLQNFWPMLHGCRFESCWWLDYVYTNKKLSHPSSPSCVLAVAPAMKVNAVQPKTTRLCSSTIVISLCLKLICYKQLLRKYKYFGAKIEYKSWRDVKVHNEPRQRRTLALNFVNKNNVSYHVLTTLSKSKWQTSARDVQKCSGEQATFRYCLVR